jgi:hypothetical protein
MADLTITATSVVKGANAKTIEGTAGATIAAGQAVYRDAATGNYLLADSNGAAAARIPGGIALNGAAVNQPVEILTEGDVTIGATLTAGTDYWLSDTPGGIAPRADVGAGENAVLIGVASSTSVLSVDIKAVGVQV